MKLLIVDDQYRVIQGMLKGINWNRVGIDTQLTALNVEKAKEILNSEDISIMLCDIEMPGESGLDLVEWVKNEGISCQCIILSAFEDFAYAQEAVRLGCFDYIIQPASYESIEASILKVKDKIFGDKQKEELEKLGKTYKRHEDTFAKNTLRNFLNEGLTTKEFQRLQERKRMPKSPKSMYLVLIQVVRWQTTEHWENNIMVDSMHNIAQEVLDTSDMKVLMTPMVYPVFSLLAWSEKEITDQDFEFRLSTIHRFYQTFFNCEMSFYLGRVDKFQEVRQEWIKLHAIKDDNVSLKQGIYKRYSMHKKDFRIDLPNMRTWYQLIKEGYSSSVEKEAFEYLDKLMDAGVINRKLLQEFYYDFLQMVYHTAESDQGFLKDIFPTPESFRIYSEGMKNVDQMKALIHHFIDYLEKNKKSDMSYNVVEEVKLYIIQHLDKAIFRDELAEHVHLNKDYLTRLFKKETGMTIKEFVIQTKMNEAQSLLRNTELAVRIISTRVGFFNFPHFSYTYKKVMGKTPNEERIGSSDKENLDD